MATVNYSSDIDTDKGTAVVTWTPLQVGPDDDGQPFEALGWRLMSVQIAIVQAPYTGTFAFEASNDGTTWASVVTAANFTLGDHKAVYFRPKVNGSAGEIKCVALFEQI